MFGFLEEMTTNVQNGGIKQTAGSPTVGFQSKDLIQIEQGIEYSPSHEAVGIGYCTICTGAVVDANQDTSNQKEMDMKTTCEALALVSVEDIVDLFHVDKQKLLTEEVTFCGECKRSLRAFRGIQIQISALTHQLTVLRSKISHNLLQIFISTPVLRLRTHLATQFLLKSVKTGGVIGTDLSSIDESKTYSTIINPSGSERHAELVDLHEDTLDIDMGYYLSSHNRRRVESKSPPRRIGRKSNDWVESGNGSAQTQTKPLEIRLVRLALDEEGKVRETRLRKLRLQKLLKRHNSKRLVSKDSIPTNLANEIDLETQGQPTTFRKDDKMKYSTTTSKKREKRQRSQVVLLRCTCCHQQCRTQTLLKLHMKKFHEKNSTPYSCGQCKTEFQNLRSLRTHEKEDHAPTNLPRVIPQRTVECEKCRLMFKSTESFNVHLERQGGECRRQEPLPLNSIFDRTQPKSKRFICGECGKKYRSPHHLRLHVRATHTEGFAFLCEHCCKRFKTKRSLIAHQRNQHVKEYLASHPDATTEIEKIRNLSCDICNITFATNNGKRYHDGMQHIKKYSFFCEICGSGWMDKVSLAAHLNRHQGQKKFKCSICNHGFERSFKLDRHMNTKHGVGPEPKLACDFCTKLFWDKTQRRNHIKAKHKNEIEPPNYEFRCSICDYNCSFRDYLINHGRTQKHIRRVAELGLSDLTTGLQFPQSHKSVKPSIIVRKNI